MKDLDQYIGRKIKGFKFESGQLFYNKAMDQFLGKEGTIVEAVKGGDLKDQYCFRVNFDSVRANKWNYPAKQALKHLVDEKPVESEQDYDYVNPSHYKNQSKETYEMMIDIWGEEAFAKHCEMCAFKYRMRLGSKPDQPTERELEKIKWYEEKARDFG